MPLSLTNDGKPTQSNKWSERDLSWREAGPAHDTWGVPGSALTKDTKNTLTVSNQAKVGNADTWDEYTIAYDDSLPDTWDTQIKMVMSNESKN